MKSRSIGIAQQLQEQQFYTDFNYVTKCQVVDIGPIEINKEENHPVQWSLIVGAFLCRRHYH
jgi:hypothetical protein